MNILFKFKNNYYNYRALAIVAALLIDGEEVVAS
jgi:hypothetical protein